MAKRFIDTELFDDPWFMDLSKDAKILWIYLITKCNHAGLIEVNEKLCKFQTGLKSLDTIYKELGNRLVTVSKQLIFIPKFIEFQYPNFPNSNVRQQASAIKLLLKYNLFNEENLTVSKELLNSYEHDTVNGIVNDTDKEKAEALNKKIEKFKKQFIPYADKYSKQMLIDFFDYWSESNQLRTKLRYELQKTWDINLRLQRWARNDKQGKRQEPEKLGNSADENYKFE